MNVHAFEQPGNLWLANARIPRALASGLPTREHDPATGLATSDFGIAPDGTLTASMQAGRRIDLGGRLVLPTFVDSHVHLDKAYIVRRTGVPAGGLLDAVKLSGADAANWSHADLQERMNRALDRAYSNGTSALRTHLDTPVPPMQSTAWQAFQTLRAVWRGRLDMQAVALMAIERVDDADDYAERCRQLAALGGILGAFIAPKTATPERLDALFRFAGEAGLDVDFHVDETLDPTARALELICDSVERTGFDRIVVAGHCCSLSTMPHGERDRIIEKVARSGVKVISLPHSNLFLQDRMQGATPSRRGLTSVQELHAAGVSVHFASDNVQDPFYPYGDYDMIDVFRSAVRAAHLDGDIGGWLVRQFQDSAAACGLSGHGRLAAGSPADLVVFDACDFYDLMSATQSARLVLRGGMPVQSHPSKLRDLFALEHS